MIADFYCYDCVKHFCSTCLGSHNEFNDYDHVVKGKVEDKDILTEKCGKHFDEFITVYCRQHDVLLCRLCQHQDHRSVNFINTMYSLLVTSSLFQINVIETSISYTLILFYQFNLQHF